MLEWERNTLIAMSKCETNREIIAKLKDMGDEKVINSYSQSQMIRFRVAALKKRLAYYRDWVDDADIMVQGSPLLQEKMW